MVMSVLNWITCRDKQS